MDIIFCIIIFIMGTVFGSFFTLAVYRIPLGLDITHERSFCPNCKHKLTFKDLIPVLSYIFLGGKCRYCGKHIRIRYLCLEILSGLIFLFAYLSFNFKFPEVIEVLQIQKLIEFVSFIFFYITVVLILGIDKENNMIEKHVLVFGIITQSLYMVYLCISNNIDLYRYVMYLGIMLILFIIDTFTLKKKTKSFYFIQILMFLDYILMFVNLKIFSIILIAGLIYSICYKIYKVIKFNFNDETNISKPQENKKIPYAFCLGIVTIIIVIANNFIVYFR